MQNLRTQKAKGLGMLHYYGFPTPSWHVVQSVAEVPSTLPWPTTFARPCPVTPRHGFLDSRKVASVDDLRALVAETLAIDPQGEVLLMPYVNARRSAVMASNQVTIGLGHDGATGGKAGAIVMPLAHVNIPKAEGVTNGYLESVISQSDDVKFVQLRDGPAAPAPRATWIPRDVTIKRILVPTDDALAWEETCKHAVPGDFAHIPGGTMVCHAAVHCVLHKIPLTFERELPALGARYKANADEAPRMYLDDVAHGISAGLLGDGSISRHMKAAVFAVHQGLVLPQSRDGARAFGAGIASLMRAGTACCLGELRHTKTGAKMLREQFMPDELQREQIYRNAWTRYLDARKLLAPAAANFANGKNWPSSSYGGKNWQNCTTLTFRVDEHAQALVANPTQSAFDALLAVAHNLINAVHNGGDLFTKVVHAVTLDRMAQANPLAVQEGAYFAADVIAAQGSAHAILPAMTFVIPVKVKKKWIPGGASFACVPLGVKIQFRDMEDGTGKTRWQIVKGKGKSQMVEREFDVPAELLLAANFANMPCKIVKSAAGSGVEYRLVARTKWKALPAEIADWLRSQFVVNASQYDKTRGPSEPKDYGIEDSCENSCDDDSGCGDPECEHCNG